MHSDSPLTRSTSSRQGHWLTRGLRFLLLVVLTAGSVPASWAWWSADWSVRQKVTLDAAAAGVPSGDPQSDVPVLVRLHTGNFQFLDAREDGGDLRVLAEDDKTPLSFEVDSFDAANEIALVWVRLPRVVPGERTSFWLYYGNPRAGAAGNAQTVHDGTTLANFHFPAGAGIPEDGAGRSKVTAATGAAPILDGAIGSALRLKAGGAVVIAGPDGNTAPGPRTFSLWLRAPDPTADAVVLTAGDAGQALTIGLEGAHVVARTGSTTLRSTSAVNAATWHDVRVTVADRIVLHINGRVEADAAAPPMPSLGGLRVGSAAFEGDIDELSVAGAVRSPQWIALSHATQGAAGRAIAVQPQERTGAAGGARSYLSILLASVTFDGWVVIGFLGAMFLVAAAVIVTKAAMLLRIGRSNEQFLAGFRQQPREMMDPALLQSRWDALESSPLYRLWRTTLSETRSRLELASTTHGPARIDSVSLTSIRAVLEAGVAEESERLNRRMVLLTIAISGGPFLGLLGTVTGVMITFAAIAAAGDVNINAIAPGIAAALVATVAGLAVAIPALFAYNLFASRIRALTVRMNTFADELLTRVAEMYGVRG